MADGKCPECDLPYRVCNAVASVREAFMEELVRWEACDRLTAWYLAKHFEKGARDGLLKGMDEAIAEAGTAHDPLTGEIQIREISNEEWQP